MRYQVGQSLRSVTDTTTVIVIRAPDDDVELTCGGRPMVDAKTEVSTALVAAEPGQTGGTLLGKRYEDPQASIELLCTKGGPNSLAVDGVAMAVKTAKPLPASD